MRHGRRFSGLTVVALAVVSALGTVSGCNAASESDVPFRRLDKRLFAASESDDKLAAVPRQVSIFERTADWAGFCEKLGVKPPLVDFAKEAVVVAFAGQKPTSGYSITVQHIGFMPEQKRLRIKSAEAGPPSSAATLQALMYPFDIVVFSRPGEWVAVDGLSAPVSPPSQR